MASTGEFEGQNVVRRYPAKREQGVDVRPLRLSQQGGGQGLKASG